MSSLKIIDDLVKLPERIQTQVFDAQSDIGLFQAAVKTEYKPNATIPMLWIVLAQDGLLLCNTHRTRGKWAVLKKGDISSINLEQGMMDSSWIKISPIKLDAKDHILPLPRECDNDAIRELLNDWRKTK